MFTCWLLFQVLLKRWLKNCSICHKCCMQKLSDIFWPLYLALGDEKSGFCCCTEAFVGPRGNSVVWRSVDGPYLLLCSPWVVDKYCLGDFSFLGSQPVPCHCGVCEPALTSLGFYPSSLNEWKEGLLQKGPSLFSAIILLCDEHMKILFWHQEYFWIRGYFVFLLPCSQNSKCPVLTFFEQWDTWVIRNYCKEAGCLLHTPMSGKGRA